MVCCVCGVFTWGVCLFSFGWFGCVSLRRVWSSRCLWCVLLFVVVFVSEVRVVSGPMICGMHLFCGVRCMRCPCCDHGVLHVRLVCPVVLVCFFVRSLCSGRALFASCLVCYTIACGVMFVCDGRICGVFCLWRIDGVRFLGLRLFVLRIALCAARVCVTCLVCGFLGFSVFFVCVERLFVVCFVCGVLCLRCGFAVLCLWRVSH